MRVYFEQAGKRADMSGLLTYIGNGLTTPHQSIIDAVKSLRIEGLKTALLTNNWAMEGEGPNRIMDR